MMMSLFTYAFFKKINKLNLIKVKNSMYITGYSYCINILEIGGWVGGRQVRWFTSLLSISSTS